jgi:hypothetical protein
LKDIDGTFAKKYDHYLEYGKDSPDKVRIFKIIQGGSDKSGIFKIFLENPTAQRKII